MPLTRRTNLLVVAVSVVLVVTATATMLQHVPSGEVGVSTESELRTGWILHAPFSPLPTIASRGVLTISDIALKTPEGSTLGFKLDLRYAAAGRLAPQLAADIRRIGFDRAIAELVRRVLTEVAARTEVESILSEPARIEGPLAAALRGAGLTPDSLSLRSSIGDELIRRRRTEEARAAAQDPMGRVLVVGWDGADWRTAEPLMAAGRMPNLARLVHEGASGNLRSYDPMFSPLLWTTVATGKSPTEHGIADFLVKDAATGERHPITSDFRRVKALWNILGDFERTSAWIGWWASYPAEPIRGTIVTDYLAAAISRSGAESAAGFSGVSSPANALRGHEELLVSASHVSRDEVARILPVTEAEYRAALQDLSNPQKHKQGESTRVDDPVSFVMRVLAQTRTYHNVALAQLNAGVPFVAVYFEGIDMMGHGFQHFLPPKMSFVSEADYLRCRDAVPNFYVWQDELFGELLRAAGHNTVTLLLSDHGFRIGDDRPNFPPSTRGQPEEWHRDWGIVVLHGPGIAAVRLPPSSIFDVTPTLLYLAGLPLADDMPGRLLASAFDPSVIRLRPPSHTKSYELVGARLEHAASATADPEVMREMLANLKALGYVGGSDDAPPRPTGAVVSENAPKGDGAAETQFFFHRNLAVAYMRQGRYRDAESELLLANERQPRAKTYAMLSEARAAEGRFADASAALEEGWKRLPNEMEPSSLLWIVELHLLGGDRLAAATVAQQWAPKMSPAVRRAVDGRLAEAAGDAASAAELYRQALDDDPLLVRIALRLQSLETAAGHPFVREPFLMKTVAEHPEVDTYWDLAGQIALARGDLPSALERFRHATDIEPENGGYLGHFASACAATGRLAEARDALNWAERFPPKEAEGWMAIGAGWDRLGETDRAVAAFDKARAASSSVPTADIGAALALARAGRVAEARKVLQEALRHFPGNAALEQLRTRLGG